MTDDRITLALVTDLGATADAAWRFRAIDRDDIDGWPSRLAATVPLVDANATLSITDLDDFSPDGLATRIPALAKLLEARAATDDASFRRLATEAGIDPDAAASAPPPAAEGESAPPPRAAPPSPEAAKDLLDSMLEVDAGVAPGVDLGPGSLERLFREAAASATPADTAAEGRRRALVDAAITHGIRSILGDPEFRRLESTWRSLRAAVTSAETGPDLRIVVLAIDGASLRADLIGAFQSNGPSRLQRALEAACESWGAIDGLFVDAAFGPEPPDLCAIAGLARVAQRIGCPAVADATPALAGAETAEALRDHRAIARAVDRPELSAWRKLRDTSLASTVGLCIPRVLLRLPWGASTSPVEGFAFEETPADAAPSYLWGSGAMALARIAARAFVTHGRGPHLARSPLGGLPVHVTEDEDGDPITRGPTEVPLPDAAVEVLREAGFIPLQAVRGTDRAWFTTVQSIAAGEDTLFGPRGG